MKNHNLVVGVLSVAFLLLASAVWLYAVPPSSTPSIGVPAALPTVLPIHAPTLVTVTIPIPDSSLIANSVNLLRLAATGTQTTILGVMHDDGQNGDAVAGDGIYTLQVPFNESTVGQLQLQVSAAFRGLLKRVTTPPINILATLDGAKALPPDPGPAGMATLAGVDSDGDGVRDDVQRYIVLTYPQSTKWRSALTQMTLAIQSEVLAASSVLLSKATDHQSSYALDCLNSVFMTSDADVAGGKAALDAYKSLQALILNTPDRARAFLQADSQLGAAVSFSSPYSLKSSRCLLDPSTLPN